MAAAVRMVPTEAEARMAEAMDPAHKVDPAAVPRKVAMAVLPRVATADPLREDMVHRAATVAPAGAALTTVQVVRNMVHPEEALTAVHRAATALKVAMAVPLREAMVPPDKAAMAALALWAAARTTVAGPVPWAVAQLVAMAPVRREGIAVQATAVPTIAHAAATADHPATAL
jgi:hypothetical protein